MIDFSDKTTCNLNQPESVTSQFASLHGWYLQYDTNGVGLLFLVLKLQQVAKWIHSTHLTKRFVNLGI